jgi:hypothetical protein
MHERVNVLVAKSLLALTSGQLQVSCTAVPARSTQKTNLTSMSSFVFPLKNDRNARVPFAGLLLWSIEILWPRPLSFSDPEAKEANLPEDHHWTGTSKHVDVLVIKIL